MTVLAKFRHSPRDEHVAVDLRSAEGVAVERHSVNIQATGSPSPSARRLAKPSQHSLRRKVRVADAAAQVPEPLGPELAVRRRALHVPERKLGPGR